MSQVIIIRHQNSRQFDTRILLPDRSAFQNPILTVFRILVKIATSVSYLTFSR